jgi:hypothetical protein
VNEASKEITTTDPSPLRYWIFGCAAALALGLVVEKSAAGNREHDDRDIWFVHATDPHIFIPAAQSRVEEENDTATPEQEPEEKACLERERKKRGREALGAKRQEELNKEALSEMLKLIASLPEAHGPAFLVLTGDLGIDPCEIPENQNQPKEDKRSAKDCGSGVKEAERKRQIEKIAELLGKSPVQKIYLVAGNNDIAKESASDEAIKYFSQFIKEVQGKLDGNKDNNVHLYDLTRGYASDEELATCYADIDDTPYRLIGFPSYSFKNDVRNVPDTAAQAEQFKKFQQLLKGAKDANRKVLVISHTPEMDDPFVLAQDLQAGITPPAAIDKDLEKSRSKWSTWNVRKEVLDGWNEAVASDSVVAVLAGHLHDSHKEVYRQPYEWSSVTEHRASFHKLFLAPPLAVKKQDTSPIQARGFSLVHLGPDGVESRPFWYDSETHQFTPDPKRKHHGPQRGFWRCLGQGSCAAIGWLWDLEKTDSALVRMAVIAIAFLTAFLTIVAMWQIPPGSDPFAEDKKDEGAKPAKPAQAASKTAADTLPFSSRFGRTVIGGLAGLVAAEITKTLGNEKASPDSRWYYIVWFILFFFLLLLSLNFLRALVEGLRSRYAIIYYPLPRPHNDPHLRPPGKFRRWLVYLLHYGLHWLSSLRVPLLTFSDTFTNLIQGKNEMRTQAFSNKIIDQQRSVLRAAKAIRRQLNTVIVDYLRDKTGEKLRPEDVRVNISALSVDQTNVFYVSKTRDSSQLSFSKRSVAWISVFTGKIRWYKQSYFDNPSLFKDIILYDNRAGTIADSEATIHLNSHYQPRGDEDYSAFAVFPVPLSRRGLSSDYVKGAIHISFRREADFEHVWSFVCTEDATKQVDAKIQGTTNDVERERLQRTRAADIDAAIKAAGPQGCDPVTKNKKYQFEQFMLEHWCKDPGVRAALNTSLRVLGEVLRGFNEHIYKNIGKSEQPD